MDLQYQFPQGDTVNSSAYASLDCILGAGFATGEARDGNTFSAGPERGPLLQYLSFREQQVSMLCLWWVTLGLELYMVGAIKRRETHAAWSPHAPSRHATELSRQDVSSSDLSLNLPLHLHVSPSYHPSLLSRLIHCAAVFEVGHQKPWKLFPSCIVHLFILLFFIMHSLLHVSPTYTLTVMQGTLSQKLRSN